MAQLDLADLSSVHQLAKQLNTEPALDFIFLNAGVMACPQSYTKNGFEMQVGTNHFGHYELASSLMDKLKQQVCIDSYLAQACKDNKNPVVVALLGVSTPAAGLHRLPHSCKPHACNLRFAQAGPLQPLAT